VPLLFLDEKSKRLGKERIADSLGVSATAPQEPSAFGALAQLELLNRFRDRAPLGWRERVAVVPGQFDFSLITREVRAPSFG
jgi:hypothetical protein